MPSPVYLDFVRYRRHRALLGAALLGVAVAAGAALLAWVMVLDSALEATAQRGATFKQALQEPAAPATLDDEEAKKLLAALHQLTAPWEDLLGAVEGAASRDVAVLSLQQQPAQNSLKLVAEARDAPSMLEFMRRLLMDKRIAAAVIENHKTDLQHPGQPVRFTVSARYASQQP